MMHYRDFNLPWPTMAEREWIEQTTAQVAAQFELPTVVHIGVELGISLYASYAGEPYARLVGVDLDCSRLFGELAVELIEKDSAQAGQAWTGPVHLLFVDGDHSLTAVLADMDAWLKHVPVGGIVAFHDYGNEHLNWCAGVRQAVDAWDWYGWQEVAAADSIKAFKRVEG